MAKRLQSPSSINLYQQCPRRYYYRYIENLPTAPSIHLIRGNIAHETLEKFFTIDPTSLPANEEKNALQLHMLRSCIQFWKERDKELLTLGLTQGELEFYHEETKIMLLNYVEMFWKKLQNYRHTRNVSFTQAFSALRPTTEVEYISEEHQVRGFLDALEVVDGRVRIMDYKTSKGSEITESYRLQLAIYALLYEQKHKERPHEVGIYFLKSTERTIPVDDRLIFDARFIIEQIHASTETDDKDDYPMKPGPLCKWSTGQCDYYKQCFPKKTTESLLGFR